jgi:hypothetical protein
LWRNSAGQLPLVAPPLESILRDLKQKTVFFAQKALKTAQKQAKNRPFFLPSSGSDPLVNYSFRASYMHIYG